jgi:hypothetical protein
MDPKHEPGDTTEDAGRRDPREVMEEARGSGPAPKERYRVRDPHEQTEPCEDHDPHELVEELDADDGSKEPG